MEHKVEVIDEDKSCSSNWGGRIILGSLVIVAGIVLLLDNLSVVKIDISSLWKLWPLLIVVTGLSILSLRDWSK